jgi:hypothetical protein
MSSSSTDRVRWKENKAGDHKDRPCEYGKGKIEGEIEVDKSRSSCERIWGILHFPRDGGFGSLALGPGTRPRGGGYNIGSSQGEVRP